VKFNKYLTPVQALVVVAVLNTACGKYPEGPGFSLASKASRLEGTWDVVEVDGEDVEDYNLELTFEKDGDFEFAGEFSFSYYGYNFSIDFDYDGEWEWIDNKEGIEVSYEDENGDNESMEFEIRRLTSTETILEDDENNVWLLEQD